MHESRYILRLDDFEKRLMINGLNSFRNDLLSKGKPTQDVSSIILKVIDAPIERRKHGREAR